MNLSNASTFGTKRVAGTYILAIFTGNLCIPPPRPRDIFHLVQVLRLPKSHQLYNSSTWNLVQKKRRAVSNHSAKVTFLDRKLSQIHLDKLFNKTFLIPFSAIVGANSFSCMQTSHTMLTFCVTQTRTANIPKD